ncbi:GNAT family N-acetyltransferase [Streptomyces peucetius]|uniref:GNAT family N-acetyltransferase n=1 Tax=Streptomyces peucetius TaxID=1950 RepID=A0ABY6I234_STRPE|nr:GNAT family N-acetyltransferase [Streptomyces peucetius]UYQ60067.1 GNAT family N-acetyltransferase [Streptomyces peucetius]
MMASSRFRVVATDTASAVDSAAWERVLVAAGGDVLSSIPFLRAVEQAKGTDQLGYCTVWEGDTAVAAFNWFLMRVDLAVLAPSSSRRVMSYLRPVTGWLLAPRVLFCGVPVSAGGRALMVDPTRDVPAIVAVVEDHLSRMASATRATLVVYKELGGSDDPVRQVLEGAGYVAATTPSMYSLATDQFGSFEDYLGSLKSHYRQDINRSLRKARRRELTLRSFTGPAAIAEVYDERAHGLYRQVEGAAEHRLEQLPREFFVALAREFPDDVFLTLAQLDGEVVGCHWGLRQEGSYYFLFCGLHYPANRYADVYFNLMYAELGNALRAGARFVQLGQTAQRFKARLGAVSSPRSVCVRGRQPVLHTVLRRLAPVLFVEEEALGPLSIFKPL